MEKNKGKPAGDSAPNKTPGEKASNEKKTTDGEGAEKSKADMKRERRAIQEAQRAKKAEATSGKPGAKPAQTAATTSKQATVPSNQPKPQQQTTSQKDNENEVSKLTSILKNTTIAQSSQITSESDQFITAPVTLKLTAPRNSGKKADSPDSSAFATNSNTSSFRLFNHFEPYKRDFSQIERLKLGSDNQVHPAFIKLGLEYANDRISGSNARCLAFFSALKCFVRDFSSSTNQKDRKPVSEELEAKLKPNINFLTKCRPLSISMGIAIKEMKQIILFLNKEISDTEAKRILYEEIENFVREKILIAGDTICKYILADCEIVISGTSYAKSKITNDDCLLIYGYSSLVVNVILRASKKFPNISVIVVDSRPRLKGRVALEHLVKKGGINCTYVLINAISFVMNRVTKVILGAHALLANGYVMSTIGSSQIALVARSFNVPVVVCCETYKFCDKVQTDALVHNELSNPAQFLEYSSKCLKQVSPLHELLNKQQTSNNDEQQHINLLPLTYDVTPHDFISCVVTDMGMLPCTSVPVVLRVKNQRLIHG